MTGSTLNVYRLYKAQESSLVGLTAPSRGIIFFFLAPLAPAELSGCHHGLQPKEKKKVEQAGILKKQISHRVHYIVPRFINIFFRKLTISVYTNIASSVYIRFK